MTTLPPVAGPYLAAVALLGAAGVAKGLRPEGTAGALRAAGLPSDLWLVRLGALGEVAIAIGALSLPGPAPAALVALAYGAFSGFLAMALSRSWPIASCGCFAQPDTRPTPSHLLLDLAAAAAATWWAIEPPASMWQAISGQQARGVLLLVASAALAGLTYLVFTNPLAQARSRRSP